MKPIKNWLTFEKQLSQLNTEIKKSGVEFNEIDSEKILEAISKIKDMIIQRAKDTQYLLETFLKPICTEILIYCKMKNLDFDYNEIEIVKHSESELKIFYAGIHILTTYYNSPFVPEGTMIIDTKPMEYSDFDFDPFNQAAEWSKATLKEFESISGFNQTKAWKEEKDERKDDKKNL